MSDDASAEPWSGLDAVAELTVGGHTFVLDRETTERLRADLGEALRGDQS